jgi:hypothetical protein
MNGLLYYQELHYIPDGLCRLRILQSRHDFPTVRHFGFNKTMELISCDFWWPQMWKTVKDYITTCDVCSRSKVPRHHSYGLLRLLSISKKPWSSISMDFITNLPSSKAFDSIFVVVNRLIKMVHFMPCNKTVTSKEIAKLFMDNIYKYHGLPYDIISDRGSQFASKFWQLLFKILKVKIKLSSSSPRAISTLYHQVPSRQLDGAVTACQVCIQQHHPRIYSIDPILCQLWIPPKVRSIRLQQSENSAAKDFATRLSEIHMEMKDKLLKAQDR